MVKKITVTPDVPNGIRHIVPIARQVFEAVYDLKAFPNNMGGGCGVCSFWLWRAIREHAPVQLTFGYVKGRYGHAWLTHDDGYIIDLTVRQFYPDQPDIAILPAVVAMDMKYHASHFNEAVCRDFPHWYEMARPMTFKKQMHKCIDNIDSSLLRKLRNSQ